MTIDPKSKLARAFRYVRATGGRPAFRGQGQTPDSPNGPGQFYGVGHAAHALAVARGMAEAPAPLYGYGPGWKHYGEEDSAFRSTVAAHDVDGAGIEHNGWYTTPERDGSGLCWGVVCQLPGRRGLCRYVAGYQLGDDEGGPSLDLSEVFESPSSGWYGEAPEALREAARMADEHARIAAEKELEYQTAWRAGSDWSGKGEELAEIRGKLLKAIPEFKAAHVPGEAPTLDSMFFDQVRDLLARRSELIEERQELAEGDCPDLVFYPSEELKGAFCEGAGISMYPGDKAARS